MKKWILTAASLGLIFLLCFTWALSQPDQPIKNLSLTDADTRGYGATGKC